MQIPSVQENWEPEQEVRERGRVWAVELQEKSPLTTQLCLPVHHRVFLDQNKQGCQRLPMAKLSREAYETAVISGLFATLILHCWVSVSNLIVVYFLPETGRGSPLGKALTYVGYQAVFLVVQDHVVHVKVGP